MNARISYCLAFVSVVAVGNSIASEGQRTVVTDVNATVLLCTLAETWTMTVVMVRPGAESLPLEESTPLEETVAIVREPSAEKYGRRYGLLRDATWSGDVRIGVFSDPNVASRVFEDQVRHVSLAPDTVLSEELGVRAVGWSYGQDQGFRRLLFVRDNVVVSVYLALWRLEQKSISRGTTMLLAKSIDTALANGTLGVNRGKTLKVPRIEQVEISPTRTGAMARVRVAVPEDPRDAGSRELEIVRAVPFPVARPSSGDEDTPVKKLRYQATYISGGCVVASKAVTVAVGPLADPPPANGS